jgi:hypothetical protein
MAVTNLREVPATGNDIYRAISTSELEDIMLPAFGPLEAFIHILDRTPGDFIAEDTVNAHYAGMVLKALYESGRDQAIEALSKVLICTR